ncbi:hypothetical protein DS745_00415 [Anaerobacillus alkaliphilus]|uniref:Uncharacterized protein n=1 Tax=Anaerobacillus alkaliphilus TaxID=1548597 RepID=A0A4Q0VWR2_9BACI|nr:bifunctional adenosylcobinamide kinase/adenosylcobinamide-phosphate guanylyltransferase [Anaerobacillus alkaliphilus]RXJ03890.1 hypothetical protein DS745_00415 [Anaerobacillus alkaliphilus]
MHFVVGGAFHGKKNWVIEHFCLNHKDYTWINGYSKELSLDSFELTEVKTNNVVIEGVEQLIITNQQVLISSISSFQTWVEKIKKWEDAFLNRQVIIIGTDMGKGIVPIDKQQRMNRDEVGRCFQVLSSQAREVSLIWYGLQQVLKA